MIEQTIIKDFHVPEAAYIHNNEVSQFTYIQVPMDLIKGKCFSNISGNAKILYGLLLNRTGLSLQNGWVDEKGRVYINYSIKDVMEEFDISERTAVRLFAELTNMISLGKKIVKKKKKGTEKVEEKEMDVYFGLIEKVRVLNQSSRIYVHKVSEVQRFFENIYKNEISNNNSNEYYFDETSGRLVLKSDENNAETAETQVVSDMAVPSGQIGQNGSDIYGTTVRSDMQEPTSQGRHENNNYGMYNNYSEHYPIKSISRERNQMSEEDERRLIDEMNCTREIIKYGIAYKYLSEDSRYKKEFIDDLIELMVEASYFSGLVTIKGNPIPVSCVRGKFEKMDMESMEYAISQINKYISGAKDPKSFMLAVLYNAVNTHRGNTIMTVHHDMAQPGWGRKPLDDSSKSDEE